MTIEFQPLPYPTSALEPNISQRTLEFHWGKHHRGYVEKTNKLIQGTRYENLSLEEIMLESFEREEDKQIFNNAAQSWNHSFFWKSLAPHASRTSGPNVKEAIKVSFGSMEKFQHEFFESGKNLFGSGWVWLVRNDEGEIEILSTKDAENPLVLGFTPLLTCDVWEHAYYLDYQNARDKFLQHFWSIINWNFVEENFLKQNVSHAPEEMSRPDLSRH